MLASERKERIKEYLLEYKSASVLDLSTYFGVSEETIRRELVVLDREGYVIRTHGGAVLAKRVSKTVDNDTLGKVFLESKQIIAEQCLQFIHEGDCIFLDASTTAATLCSLIYDMHMTVLTNSLRVIRNLSKAENINLICVGGNYSKDRESFIGRTTNMVLSNHYVDMAFISCRSLSIESGITDSNDEEAEVKQIISRHSNRVFLIADYSKFGKTSFTKVCDFSDIDDIVTDRPLTDEWRGFLEEKGINVWDNSVKE
jgi:DeoR/GlpR family transcriptional regulator of sugar metabolism